MDKGPTFDVEAVMEAMGPLIGIDVASEDREGVADGLRTMADFAAILFAFPFDDHDEPAPVFEA